MSVAIFTPTPYINKWQMSLCNNSSDNKSYWIHRVDVKVSAQVTTITYMHQSQPSLHSLRKHLTVHLELWPGNHWIRCNATCNVVWFVSAAVSDKDERAVRSPRFSPDLSKLVFLENPAGGAHGQNSRLQMVRMNEWMNDESLKTLQYEKLHWLFGIKQRPDGQEGRKWFV